MRLPPVTLPVVGAIVAVAATGLPVVLHHRDPDVINLGAGTILLLAGTQLVAWESTRLAGRCLVLSSMAWFAPDLAVDAAGLEPLLTAATLAHLPPLVAATLLAAEGRWARRDAWVLAMAVVTAISAGTGGYQVLVPALGLVVMSAGASTWLSLPRRLSRPALTYLGAVIALGAALTGVPLWRLAFAGVAESRLFAMYAGLLVAVAVALVSVGPWLQRSAALDVDADALAGLDGLLADLTGDRAAHAAVKVGDGHWLRLDGTATRGPVADGEAAVVVAVRPVPESLAGAVDDAVRLAADNVRARWLVTDKIRELDALRTRLVRVEDDERSALVSDLRRGPLAALTGLRTALLTSGAAPELVEQLDGTQRDIAQVAAGLDPLLGSTSVADAVRRLAEQQGAAADLDLEIDIDATTGRALWFACSEALTNAAKHAEGAATRVQLFTDGDDVVLVVSDNGPGPGAAAEVGAATLPAVRDRLAALGGTLTVAGARPGTRVEVRVRGTRQHVGRSGVGADADDPEPYLASRAPTSEVPP